MAQYYDTIHTDYLNFLAGDKDALKNLVDLNITLFDKIGALEIESRSISHQFSPILDRLAETEKELAYLKHENQKLKHKLSLTEDLARVMYLRVEGVSEFHNENLNVRVATILSGTGTNCVPADIDFTRRIGNYKDGYTRPILVRFQKEAKRNAILYNRANINRNKTSNFIWVSDDISEETRRYRKTVRDIAALANINGTQNIKVHGDGLILDGVKYRHNDLDLLPPALSVEKAKTRENDTDIYFQGESSPFSNFYHSKLTDDSGAIYYSVEQAFQNKKARFHGKLLLADKIMCERNPYDIKKMSKDIPSSKDWLDQEEEVMLSILHNKYEQNQELATKLVNTGQKQLHEATGDHKWSTGAELASKTLLNSEWKGQDLMGKLLETVRTDLIAMQSQHTLTQAITAHS